MHLRGGRQLGLGEDGVLKRRRRHGGRTAARPAGHMRMQDARCTMRQLQWAGDKWTHPNQRPMVRPTRKRKKHNNRDYWRCQYNSRREEQKVESSREQQGRNFPRGLWCRHGCNMAAIWRQYGADMAALIAFRWLVLALPGLAPGPKQI